MTTLLTNNQSVVGNIAHSASPEWGIKAQSYTDHVKEVKRIALNFLDPVLDFYTGDPAKLEPFRCCVSDATSFHDIGKLHPDNQAFLQTLPNHKMLNHVDAGVAFLMRLYKEWQDNALLYAALIVHGHHIGILNKGNHEYGYNSITDKHDFLRDPRPLAEAYSQYAGQDERVCDFVDRTWENLIDKHLDDTNCKPRQRTGPFQGKFSLFEIRLLASCAYAADHIDTTRNYGGYVVDSDATIRPLLPSQRLKQLDEKSKEKSKKARTKNGKLTRWTKINKIRSLVYHDCRTKPLRNGGFYLCDAYVGCAKTYATLALGLRLAERFKCRRIIGIAPFTTIINQTVDAYRDAIILPHEKIKDKEKEKIVIEHHHQNEYSDDEMIKTYSVGWFGPLTVTTAVQFFESLATNLVVPLKKLHQIPGSVIIIDEFHSSIPSCLWELAAKWLRELVENWGCHVIFSSGTPIELWKIKELRAAGIKPKKILSRTTYQQMKSLENKCIKYRKLRDGKPLSPDEIINEILKRKGPRLVVCNTIQNAAVIATLLKNKCGKDKVEHLSTALTIGDRKEILDRVKERLKSADNDWTLVATSCVEAGVDISFRVSFREATSLMSIQQISGRTDRERRGRHSVVNIFQLNTDHPWFTAHPMMEAAKNVMLQIFNEEKGKLNPSLCSAALEREIRTSSIAQKMALLRDAEDNDIPETVRKEFRVIDTYSIPVLMNSNVFRRLMDLNFKESVKLKDIYKHLTQDSVTVFFGKIERPDKFPTLLLADNVEDAYYEDKKISKIDPNRVRLWGGYYDADFLGYMSHILMDLDVPGVEPGINVPAGLNLG